MSCDSGAHVCFFDGLDSELKIVNSLNESGKQIIDKDMVASQATSLILRRSVSVRGGQYAGWHIGTLPEKKWEAPAQMGLCHEKIICLE